MSEKNINVDKQFDLTLDDKGYIIEVGSYRSLPAPLLGSQFQGGRVSYSTLDFWQISGCSDFAKGMGQKFLVDPSMFYRSEGVDVSEPGEFRLAKKIKTLTGFPSDKGEITARYRSDDSLYLGTSTGKILMTSDGVSFSEVVDTGAGKIYAFFQLDEKLFATKGDGKTWVLSKFQKIFERTKDSNYELFDNENYVGQTFKGSDIPELKTIYLELKAYQGKLLGNLVLDIYELGDNSLPTGDPISSATRAPFDPGNKKLAFNFSESIEFDSTKSYAWVIKVEGGSSEAYGIYRTGTAYADGNMIFSPRVDPYFEAKLKFSNFDAKIDSVSGDTVFYEGENDKNYIYERLGQTVQNLTKDHSAELIAHTPALDDLALSKFEAELFSITDNVLTYTDDSYSNFLKGGQTLWNVTKDKKVPIASIDLIKEEITIGEFSAKIDSLTSSSIAYREAVGQDYLWKTFKLKNVTKDKSAIVTDHFKYTSTTGSINLSIDPISDGWSINDDIISLPLDGWIEGVDKLEVNVELAGWEKGDRLFISDKVLIYKDSVGATNLEEGMVITNKTIDSGDTAIIEEIDTGRSRLVLSKNPYAAEWTKDDEIKVEIVGTLSEAGKSWNKDISKDLAFEVWNEEAVTSSWKEIGPEGLFWVSVEDEEAFGLFGDGIRTSSNGIVWVPEPPDPLWSLPDSEVALGAITIPRGFLIGTKRGLWVFTGGGSSYELRNFSAFASSNNFQDMDTWSQYAIFGIENRGIYYTAGTSVYPTNILTDFENFVFKSLRSVLKVGQDIWALVSDSNDDWYLARCNMKVHTSPSYWTLIKKLDREPVHLASFDKDHIYIFYKTNAPDILDFSKYESSGYLTTSLIDEGVLKLQKYYRSLSIRCEEFPLHSNISLNYKIDNGFWKTAGSLVGSGQPGIYSINLPNPTRGNRIQVRIDVSQSGGQSPVITDVMWKFFLLRPKEDPNWKKKFYFSVIAEDSLALHDGSLDSRSRTGIINDIWASKNKNEIIAFEAPDSCRVQVLKIKSTTKKFSVKVDRANEELIIYSDNKVLRTATLNCTLNDLKTSIDNWPDFEAELTTEATPTDSATVLGSLDTGEEKKGTRILCSSDRVFKVIFDPAAPSESLRRRNSTRIQVALREI